MDQKPDSADVVALRGASGKTSKAAVTVWLSAAEIARLDNYRLAVPIGTWKEELSRGRAIRHLVLTALPLEPPTPLHPIRPPRCEKGKGHGCMFPDGHLGMCKDGISDDD